MKELLNSVLHVREMESVEQPGKISITPRYSTFGIVMSVIGIIVVIVSLILQFSVINHGTSNQLTVDDRVRTNIISVLTGVSVFAVGFALWLLFTRIANKYLAVFLLAFASLFISQIAVVFSLYQVTVTKV